jgi:hypothetical protein
MGGYPHARTCRLWAVSEHPLFQPPPSARSESMKEQRMIEAAYEAAHGADRDTAWYGATVQPLLAGFTLPVIAKAVGVSTSAAAQWRANRAIPHVRHWTALAELVGVGLPRTISGDLGAG